MLEAVATDINGERDRRRAQISPRTDVLPAVENGGEDESSAYLPRQRRTRSAYASANAGVVAERSLAAEDSTGCNERTTSSGVSGISGGSQICSFTLRSAII